MTLQNNKLNEILRYSANGILFILSGFLSVNLYCQFSEVQFIKILFGFMALAFEMTRYYQFVIGKAYWKKKQYARAGFRFLIYGLLASTVVIASAGFTLSALNKQSLTVDSYIIEKTSALSDIEAIDKQIGALIISQGQITNSWTLGVVNKSINKLRADKQALTTLLKSEYSETKINISKSIFDSLGKPIGVPGENIKLYLLIVLSILLEVSLMLTSINIQDDKPETKPLKENEFVKENKGKLLTYIDSLMDIPPTSKRLNGNWYIKEKTRLNNQECAKFRKELTQIKLNGQPLIFIAQGTSKANYDKNTIKEYIINLSKI